MNEDYYMEIDSTKITYDEVSNLPAHKGIVKRILIRLDKYNWNEINSWIADIDLQNLNTFKSAVKGGTEGPFDKLTIITTNKSYQTQIFSRGYPPKEIFRLMFGIDRMLNVRLIDCDYKPASKN